MQVPTKAPDSVFNNYGGWVWVTLRKIVRSSPFEVFREIQGKDVCSRNHRLTQTSG